MIGYFTGGVDRGAGLSASGHLIGYVTVDGPGFGNRSVPGEPVAAVPEFAKMTTTATIPKAIAVCRRAPAGNRECSRTTVPSALLYVLINGTATSPYQSWCASLRNRPMKAPTTDNPSPPDRHS
ncbi:hypothetical protein [Streptomyces sp. NBC_01353]|uniref:hypothetical protein n=1 Tax=Streptomyces sp. NBC_01353 TaxID=2903835 RepID=UPI002E346494|nr:hypothetical protein [Streptomyces sp. NBC_01353]